MYPLGRHDGGEKCIRLDYLQRKKPNRAHSTSASAKWCVLLWIDPRTCAWKYISISSRELPNAVQLMRKIGANDLRLLPCEITFNAYHNIIRPCVSPVAMQRSWGCTAMQVNWRPSLDDIRCLRDNKPTQIMPQYVDISSEPVLCGDTMAKEHS